jgi:hypothetical protein
MESMDTTWAPLWTTTDVTKFMSQKQKARAFLTLLSFSCQNCPCHIHLQKIWPAFQPWNFPMPCKTQPLQRRLVTLVQHNFKHCANYQTFSQRHFHLGPHNMHPQWRKTPHDSGALFHRAISPKQTAACESRLYQQPPNQSPQLSQHRSQRVSPIQVPSPRVTPRMNPINVW